MGPSTTLQQLYAEYVDDPTPDSGCVEFVFHTYHGFLFFGEQREHRFRLPPDRARELLWRFHQFNLTWGLLTPGLLFIPLLSWGNYRAQKLNIRKQEQMLKRASGRVSSVAKGRGGSQVIEVRNRESAPAANLFVWEVFKSEDGPGPRSRHCLVYDAARRATILFGGIIWSKGGVLRSDTWEWRDGSWSRIECPKRPPARHRGSMVFDAVRGNSILFGGQGSSNELLRDTWTYTDGHWLEWRGGWWPQRPSARCGHCLAFDETTGEVVLFGGVGRFGSSLEDTWLFDGRSWRPVPGPTPPARRYAAFAYDPTLKGCILHGGARDDAGRWVFGDSWLFRENAWTRLGPEFDTDPRDDHGLAYHRAAGGLVMLEGIGGVRGILVREENGWRPAEVRALHPRHQCSPMVWDEEAGGLLLHGGETHHGGRQFGATLVLKLTARSQRRQSRHQGHQEDAS